MKTIVHVFQGVLILLSVFVLFFRFFLVFRESDAVIVRPECENIKSSYFKFIYTITAQFIGHEKCIFFAVVFHFAEKR